MEAAFLDLDVTMLYSSMGTMAGVMGYDHCLDIMLKILADG